MSDDDDELNFVEKTPDGAADADVIGGRTPRRWTVSPGWLAGFLAVVLAAGIGVGYLIDRPGRHRAAAPTVTVTAAPSAPAFILDPINNLCYGIPAPPHQLMLGVEVANNTKSPVVLDSLVGAFPLGQLRQVDTQVGQCDDNSTERVNGHVVDPGAAVWLSLTVEVLIACPAPLPVVFKLNYHGSDGSPGSQEVPGFPDLGGIPYRGCTTTR